MNPLVNMTKQEFDKIMKAIGLVVVCGGVAYAHAPDHVDLRIVDTDNQNERGEPKASA